MSNKALDSAMKAAGVSPRTLAVHAGVDAKTVGRWLSGESQPRKPNARAAAAALGCRPEELWRDVMNQPDFDASATVLISSPADAIADLRAVYPTRTQFLAAHPLDQLFAHATDICMSGLSLNLLCQQYPDTEIVRLLSDGVSIRCLFLKPGGHHISDREAEEHHAPQVLSNLTTSNIHTLQRIQTRLSEEVAAYLQMRLYDDPVRFNIMRINSAIAIVQPYLPGARGVESPTLVIQKRDAPSGLFNVFSNVFDYYWDRGEPVG
jgi:lambda repressor-like predicted transcriptional regulator